jgi:hypothetical protein
LCKKEIKVMDTSTWVRDPKFIGTVLHELTDDSLVCSKKIRIFIPSRFAERGLASLGAENYIIGILAIECEPKYAIMLVNAMLRIDPAEINRVQFGEEEYFEFVFYPGNVVVPNLNLAKTDTLTYKIYDEMIAKARVPWYVTYLDMAHLFDTAREHAGAKVGTNKEVTELLISVVARNKDKRVEYYRQIIQNESDLITNPPSYVPLKDITLTATNTINKLGGGYFRQGTISAIVAPSERVDNLENLLLQ